MIIETVTCPKCGKSLRIETDLKDYMEKRKAQFEKEHAKCKPTKNTAQ
jgi:hypothetical protein